MRLRRVDCGGPGWTRRKRGKGFTYHDERGAAVSDAVTIARIRALAIPPAWTDVWICPAPNGHIQATGIDAAGRRQYRYHDVWRQRRDAEKFDHMLDFARALPRLRRKCAAALAGTDFDRERVLGCATRLLDLGFFRIGTEEYAEDNQTYGLATLHKSHVTLGDGCALTFCYTAKHGIERIQSIVDPDVYRVVAELKRRRGGGRELLAWRNESGRWTDVKSADINAFVRQTAGGQFTAKDFRTWNATVLAAVALAVSTEARSATARARAVRRAYAEVAHYLGNTPAVARSSYVDPRIVDHYRAGHTIEKAVGSLADAQAPGPGLATQGKIEAAVLKLLAGGAPARTSVAA